MEEPTSTPQQGHETREPERPNPREDSAAAGVSAGATATATATATDQGDKERKLDHDGFRSSKYFKICSIVKDLRPYFVEVSQTPNFRDSKAAHEIQIRMKTLIELTRQLRSDAASITKRNETPAEVPLSAAVKEEHMEKQQEGAKQAPQPQPGEDLAASVSNMGNDIRENKEELKEMFINLDKGEFSGPFLVGGSPIGWNFLVFPGLKPVFYGVSKENALTRRATE